MGVDNYARFYALLRRMPCADKETLVSQYSDGRTTHLRELSGSEYRAMCDAMARVAGEDESRRGLGGCAARRCTRCSCSVLTPPTGGRWTPSAVTGA